MKQPLFRQACELAFTECDAEGDNYCTEKEVCYSFFLSLCLYLVIFICLTLLIYAQEINLTLLFMIAFGSVGKYF